MYRHLVRRWLDQPVFGGAGRYRVTAASTLAQALDCLACSSFDVVVLDLGLPDSHGDETLGRLRAATTLPVVVLSVQDDETVASKLVELGAQDYIPKAQGDGQRLRRSLSYALQRHGLEMALRRQNQALRALSDCNQMVGRAQNRDQLLRDVCRVVAERTGYRFVWIGVVHEGPPPHLQPIAWAGQGASYLRQISIRLDAPPWCQGPAAKAIRLGETQVVADTANDPSFAPWRDAALAHGHRSVVALPLKTSGGFQGALVVYSGERNAFDEGATSLLEELAANLCVGLDRIEAHEREREAERERRVVEARYRLLTEVAPVGIFHLTPKGRCTYANDRLYEIVHARREEVLGYGWQRFLAADELGRMIADWGRSGRRETFASEVRVVQRDGEELWVAVQLTSVGGASGRHLGYVGAVLDITARRKAEEAFEHLNRSLEQKIRERTKALEEALGELEAFSHSLAHDIRAPLRRVVAFCELLNMRCGEELSEQARHYAGLARANAAHLDRLLQDLLSLARVRSRPLERRTVDFSRMCERILAGLKENEPQRRVEWSVQPNMVFVADAYLLEVAAFNLLENAWKYTRPRSLAQIVVGCEVLDGEQWFYVRDNGVGFDPTQAERLFQPFSRLHHPQEFEGTGIGLATVDRIIARHGGKIRVTGSPGDGATFAFTLGIESQAGATEQEPTEHVPVGPGLDEGQAHGR